MTKPIARDPIYRKRAFDADIIELCVRWYITCRLSYRVTRRGAGPLRLNGYGHARGLFREGHAAGTRRRN